MLACNKYLSNILYSTFYPFSIFPYCGAIHRAQNEGSGREDFTDSRLKLSYSAFTFQTLLRHYASQFFFGPRLANYLNCESASRLVASSSAIIKGRLGGEAGEY